MGVKKAKFVARQPPAGGSLRSLTHQSKRGGVRGVVGKTERALHRRPIRTTGPHHSPVAAAEAIREGIGACSPTSSRRRPRRGTSGVRRPAGRPEETGAQHPPASAQMLWAGAQDCLGIHPAVMPHPLRGAGHPRSAMNHPAGGPRRRGFVAMRCGHHPTQLRNAWTPPHTAAEATRGGVGPVTLIPSRRRLRQ